MRCFVGVFSFSARRSLIVSQVVSYSSNAIGKVQNCRFTSHSQYVVVLLLLHLNEIVAISTGASDFGLSTVWTVRIPDNTPQTLFTHQSGGGFMFLFHPHLGKIPILTSIFFEWVVQPPTRSIIDYMKVFDF